MQALWSRARPARWHSIFFLLIAADAVIVLVTMFVGWRIHREFVFSLAASERWSERIGRLEDVSRLAIELNAPGNDVFASGDVSAERARLETAEEAVSSQLSLLRREPTAEFSDGSQPEAWPVEIASTLFKYTDSMVDHAEKIFDNLEAGNREAAGVEMAAMDAQLAQTLTATHRLSSEARAGLHDVVTSQRKTLATFGRVRPALFTAVGMILVSLVWWGRILSQAQREADRLQRKLATIVEAAYHGLLLVDRNRVVRFASPSAAVMLGYTADEIVGLEIENFVPLSVRERHPSLVNEYLANPSRRELNVGRDLMAVCKDGREFPVEDSLSPVRYERETQILVTLINISERKRLEAELVNRIADLDASRQLAEQASLAKSEFLANMSHEIRTPMTAILGYADMLLMDCWSPGAEKDRIQAIHTIQRAGEHLLAVINDILDLSKIEAGRLQIELKETSLPTLLLEVDSLMRQRVDNKGVALRTKLLTPIPNWILGDSTRIRQILMNLVGNAAKFTKHGEIEIRAGIKRQAMGTLLRMEVEDAGIGMTPEQAERLFQPFTQADGSITRRFGGTGLGLTICRRLTEMMSGNIWLDHSELGRGSRFVVEIPLFVAEESNLISDLGAIERNPLPNSRDYEKSGLEGRILLVEDGPDNQRLIAFHLGKAGAEVVVAERGLKALEVLEDDGATGQSFDLIVTDMQMPEMDGYSLARTLRSRGMTVPIVALTAHAMAEDREKCVAAGCDDYLTKPIDRDLLVKTCARWMAEGNARGAQSTVGFANESVNWPSHEDNQTLRGDFVDDPERAELVADFLKSLSKRIHDLQTCFGQRDVEGIARIAHQVKGAAGGYGFPLISAFAGTLERLAKRASNVAEVAESFDVLMTLCRLAAAGAGDAGEVERVDVSVGGWNE